MSGVPGALVSMRALRHPPPGVGEDAVASVRSTAAAALARPSVAGGGVYTHSYAYAGATAAEDEEDEEDGSEDSVTMDDLLHARRGVNAAAPNPLLPPYAGAAARKVHQARAALAAEAEAAEAEAAYEAAEAAELLEDDPSLAEEEVARRRRLYRRSREAHRQAASAVASATSATSVSGTSLEGAWTEEDEHLVRAHEARVQQMRDQIASHEHASGRRTRALLAASELGISPELVVSSSEHRALELERELGISRELGQ